MNLRSATRSFRAVLGATALILAVSAPAQTVDNKPEVKQAVIERVTDLLTKSAYVPGIDFKKFADFIEGERGKIDTSGNDDEFQRSVNAALAKFGASHIVLTTPKQADSRRTGQSVGIGINVQPTEEGLVVVRTVKGAPAEEAGLQPGDIILTVDGNKVEGTKGISGPEDTTVVLKVKRKSGKTEDFTIPRKKFSTIRPEELTWVDKDTAKLNVYTFDLSYSQENVEKLMKEAAGAKNLILDLRDNGGGAVFNLEHLLGLFLPSESPIGTFVSRRAVDGYVKETGGKESDLKEIAEWSKEKIRPRKNRRVPIYEGNVVVLVNRASGSASEIAAAALKETGKATVVGTKSAGAVLVSVIVPASNGFMLQYPLSDYVTIKGLRLEGNGVTPDIEAADPLLRLPDAKDECVEKARTIFAQISNKVDGVRIR